MRSSGKKKPRPKPKQATWSYRPFAGLEGFPLAPDSPPEPATPAPTEPPRDSPGRDADRDLFLSAVEDAKPLEGPNRLAITREREHRVLSETDRVLSALCDLVDGKVPFDIADTDEFIEAHVRGLNRGILRRLRQGEFSVQAHLDLHGMSRIEARDAVRNFIVASQTAGLRCVLIVHGHGHGSRDHVPVLKEKLKAWLTNRSFSRRVLAYSSAQPYDGGTGAVYVLLRR